MKCKWKLSVHKVGVLLRNYVTMMHGPQNIKNYPDAYEYRKISLG
jgi:hypothetical protein